MVLSSFAIAALAAVFEAHPGGGPYFPSFHPRMHTAHNNDVNGPFYFNGVYHIFMQQDFPWVKGWNGAIGWGHMVSVSVANAQVG